MFLRLSRKLWGYNFWCYLTLTEAWETNLAYITFADGAINCLQSVDLFSTWITDMFALEWEHMWSILIWVWWNDAKNKTNCIAGFHSSLTFFTDSKSEFLCITCILHITCFSFSCIIEETMHAYKKDGFAMHTYCKQ